MASSINIQEMATSAYNIIMMLLNSAVELAGLDTLWARATPHKNSEDVIMQEYTLSDVGVECPKELKILTSNSDYNPGLFTVDLFGINYNAPLEIQISIDLWQSVFGTDTQPQKGDIVYIKLMHKLYEVMTAEVIYLIASMPTYFHCQLTKYNPTASRKETEEFRVSIDELTVSQEELFGDAISQDVADIVNDVETRYNNTTYEDPIKDFDISSIKVGPYVGSHGNQFSNACYAFAESEKNVTYNIAATYEVSAERNHWIYSLWFRDRDIQNENGKVISLNVFSKDKRYWYYTITSTLKMEIGDEVTITRGNLMKVTGTIVELECEEGYGLRITYKDATKANKKLTEWWKSKNLKVYKEVALHFLTAYNNDDEIINIKYYPLSYKLTVKINDVNKEYKLGLFDIGSWNYIAFDISPKSIHIILNQAKVDALNVIDDKVVNDITDKIELSDFSVTEFRLENIGTAIEMCNIRLYENEFEFGDLYLKDMYSIITLNASKLILVDSPNVPNSNNFQSPVR